MKKILLFLLAASAIGCAETPEQSVQALVDALADKDSVGIATYLDVSRAAETVTDPLLELARYVGENEPGAFGGQVDQMQLQMLQAMRPMLPAMIAQVFWQVALVDEDGPNPLTAVLMSQGVDLSDAAWSYDGADYVETVNDSVMVVGALLNASGLDEAVTLPLIMEKMDGHWQVVGVRDFENAVAQITGRD